MSDRQRPPLSNLVREAQSKTIIPTINLKQMGLSSTLGLFGILFFSHFAYSTIQCTVVAELILGFVLCIYAGLNCFWELQSIHPFSPQNRIVSLPENFDFMIINRRGRLSLSASDIKHKF